MMEKRFLIGAAAICLLSFSSCKDENTDFDDHGSTAIVSMESPSQAFMGDSITLNYEVKSNGVKINQAKLQLYYGDELVSENFYSLQHDGRYEGRVAVPFMKNIPDGDAKLVLRVQNERFASDSREAAINVSRPKFGKLLLKGADGTVYDMTPTDKPYEYHVRAAFPAEMPATISIPAYGENGNAMVFGMANGKITNGGAELINFEGDPDADGMYDITFNTKSFEGTPFIKFGVYFNDRRDVEGNAEVEEFSGSGDIFKVETIFHQGEDIQISGLKADYVNFWINPSFFRIVKGSNGKVLRFLGAEGKYRLTVDKANKYFDVELMDGNELASIGSAQNAKVVWCIGNNIGFPSVNSRGIHWDSSKAQALCPLGNGVHQLVLEAGRNIYGGGDDPNFKFFGQKNWGFEFAGGAGIVADGTTWFNINGGDGNIHHYGDNPELKNGYFYVITYDTSKSPCEMRVQELETIGEVEAK